MTMESPAHIIFKNMDPIARVEEKVRSELGKVEKLFGRITTARVIIDRPQHRHRKGDLYAVSVHITLPSDREVFVNRDPGKDHAHEDVNVAVRDAFSAAKRQLKETGRRLRGDVKHHEPQPMAKVGSLMAESDYGFLQTEDGREIYFHRNSVINDHFDDLKVGDKVVFAESEGEKGPQASTVRPL